MIVISKYYFSKIRDRWKILHYLNFDKTLYSVVQMSSIKDRPFSDFKPYDRFMKRLKHLQNRKIELSQIK